MVCVSTVVLDQCGKELSDLHFYVPSWELGFRCTTNARFIVLIREKDVGEEKCKFLTL